ncbi:MAG: endogenous inhibitor of DNA gyrase (YacG/DUF329 family) [Candidatus Pseudothioglobus sp.]|jgi:endogenous inhibitor of DNA gyrase (YacG/DUF329 family)
MARLEVKCPTCQKPVHWVEENIYRPFCSERCQLIDLGEWASGKHFIPVDPTHDDVTSADLDSGDLPGPDW